MVTKPAVPRECVKLPLLPLLLPALSSNRRACFYPQALLQPAPPCHLFRSPRQCAHKRTLITPCPSQPEVFKLLLQQPRADIKRYKRVSPGPMRIESAFCAAREKGGGVCNVLRLRCTGSSPRLPSESKKPGEILAWDGTDGMPIGGGGLLAVEGGAVAILDLGRAAAIRARWPAQSTGDSNAAARAPYRPYHCGETTAALPWAIGGAVSGRSATDGRMAVMSGNIVPGATEERRWSLSLACVHRVGVRAARARRQRAGRTSRPAPRHRGDGRRDALACKDVARDVRQGGALADALAPGGARCAGILGHLFARARAVPRRRAPGRRGDAGHGAGRAAAAPRAPARRAGRRTAHSRELQACKMKIEIQTTKKPKSHMRVKSVREVMHIMGMMSTHPGRVMP